MKRTLTLLITLLCLHLPAVHARQFVGLPSSALVTDGGVTRFVGIQVGTYELGNRLGLRANAEFVSTPDDGPVAHGGVDLLYRSGESNIFYAGVGGGYASDAGDDSLYLAGTAGVDFDAASRISYFLEVQPRYDLVQEEGFLYLRSGVNVHFGD